MQEKPAKNHRKTYSVLQDFKWRAGVESENQEALGLHGKNCERIRKDSFTIFRRPICQSQDIGPTLVLDKNKAIEPWE